MLKRLKCQCQGRKDSLVPQISRSERRIVPTITEAPAPGDRADPRRWLTLAVVLAAPLMAIFDQFVVNVAIPTMQRDLHASFGAIQFVIAGYALAYAVLLITGGRLGDIFGRKRLFLIGMMGFTLASALCGLAPTPEALIGFRVLQGAAAALMSPQVLAIIQVTFTEKDRAKAFGAYGAVLGVSGALGQVLGGLLIRADIWGLGWRAVFLVNVPVGLIAVPTAFALLPESRAPLARRLDIGGVLIVSASVLALAYPLVAGRDAGWPPWTWLCLAASVPLLFVFVRFERRQAARGGSPLMDLTLFSDRAFRIGLVVLLIYAATSAGYFLILALHLQIGLHFSPLAAGATFLPDAVAFFIAASLSSRLIPRFGVRLLNIGFALKCVGLTAVILVARHLGQALHGQDLAPELFVQGFGSGFISAPLIGLILARTRNANVGSASGVLTTVQQIAGAIGVALVGILFFGLLAGGADGVAAQTIPAVQAQLGNALPATAVADTVTDFRACVHDRAAARDPAVPPVSCARPSLAPTEPVARAALLRDVNTAMANVYTNAFTTALACIVAALAVACGVVFLLPSTHAT